MLNLLQLLVQTGPAIPKFVAWREQYLLRPLGSLDDIFSEKMRALQQEAGERPDKPATAPVVSVVGPVPVFPPERKSCTDAKLPVCTLPPALLPEAVQGA